MKAFAYTLLILFGAYAALKYYSLQVSVVKRTQNQVVAPPGVNYYCATAIPQRPAQALAFLNCNTCSVTQKGFSAAFGPNENQPQNIVALEI